MGPAVKDIENSTISYEQKQVYEAQQALIKALK